MIQWNIIENIRMVFYQIQIPFFRCFEDKIFNFSHRHIKCFLRHQTTDSFPLMRLFVERMKVGYADISDRSIGHRFRVIIARNLIDKTFERHDKLMLGVKKNIFLFARFFINHIRAKNAIIDKPQMLTNRTLSVISVAFFIFFLMPKRCRKLKVFCCYIRKLMERKGKNFYFFHSYNCVEPFFDY